MSVQSQYLQKRMPAADAVRLVRDGDFIIVPTGVGEPPTLLTALSEQRLAWRDVKVAQILAVRKYGYIDPATTEHVRHVAFFYGGATRLGGREGWVDFLPNYFSEIPLQIERGQIPADVVFSMASPMDAEGRFALSLGADYTMAAVAKARAVVLEVNPNVPYAFGNCHVHISQVAALVESSEPVLEVGLPKIGPVQQAIAEHVAHLIEDGSTLQIGYGGIPDAVVMQLTHKHDLGIHTEMIGDGIMTLVESGAVTNRRKNYLPGKMVATFALGSNKLYRFMERNPHAGDSSGGLHQRPGAGRPERQAGGHQRHAADRPARPVRLGKSGARALFGHRRAGRLRARGQPLARRQGLHRPAVDRQGRPHLAHRARARARHPCQHQQERHQLRRHRIRRGPTARQIGQAACARADRDRPPVRFAPS